MFELTEDILELIREQAKAEAPNEACGYIGGSDSTGRSRYPMRNVDESPEHFSFDPAEQFGTLKKARSAGEKLIAVYHSHPATPPRMSEEDLRLANDTSMVYIIYSLATDQAKAFRVDKEKKISEVPLSISGGTEQQPS